MEEGGRGDRLPAAEVWAPRPTPNPGRPPEPCGLGGHSYACLQNAAPACSSLKWSYWGGEYSECKVHRRVMFKVHIEHEIYTLNSGPQISIIGLIPHLHQGNRMQAPPGFAVSSALSWSLPCQEVSMRVVPETRGHGPVGT